MTGGGAKMAAVAQLHIKNRYFISVNFLEQFAVVKWPVVHQSCFVGRDSEFATAAECQCHYFVFVVEQLADFQSFVQIPLSHKSISLT